jgi:hypothetical protein
MTAGRIVRIVLGCSLPTAIEAAVSLRDAALDALFMVIRFTDVPRPTGGQQCRMWWRSEMLAAATDLASIGSALSADGQGGLVCRQEGRRRGGGRIMAADDESD